MANTAKPVIATGKRVLTLLEKGILGFIAGVALAVGLLDAVFAVGRVASLAGTGPIELRNVPVAEPVPVNLGDSSAIVSTSYHYVTLVMADLPDTSRAALVAASIVTSILTVGVCAAVVWLCIRVFVGRPFVRSAVMGISVVSVLVLLAGLGAPFLRGIANTEAVAHAGLGDLALLLFETDFAPLGWAFALTVVAAAFEIGQRLQRETEGLV